MGPKKSTGDDIATTVHKLVKKGDVEGLKKLLLDHPAQVLNLESTKGLTALGAAVENGDDCTVEALIQLGADVNLAGKGASNQTPLLLACWGNDDVCAHLLLSAGADPNVADSMNRTALHALCSTAALDLLQFLTSPDVENAKRLRLDELLPKADKNGMNVFHILCAEVHSSPRVELVYDFITTNASKSSVKQCLFAKNARGDTPLHLLLSGAREETTSHVNRVRELLEVAPLVEVDAEGALPLSRALENGHLRIVTLLVEAMRATSDLKRAVNQVDSDGNCVAIYALRSDSPHKGFAEFLRICPEFDVATFKEELLDAAVDLTSADTFALIVRACGPVEQSYEARLAAKEAEARPEQSAPKTVSTASVGDYSGKGADTGKGAQTTAIAPNPKKQSPTWPAVLVIIIVLLLGVRWAI